LFNVHGAIGEYLLQVGLGVYPNQDMIDAWVCGVHADRQFNIRVARPLKHDRSNLHVGPLRVDIVQPMSEWRIRLDDNEYGLSCDLTFRARAEAFEFDPVFVRRNNVVEWHQMHLIQSGTFTGWLQIGEHRVEGVFGGSRDRSWGVRGPHANQAMDMKTHAPIEGDASVVPKRADNTRRAWIAAEFPDRALHGWFWTDDAGKVLIADGAFVDVSSTGAEHRPRFVAWKPVPQVGAHGYPESVVLGLIDENQEEHEVIARPLLCRSPEGNGYFKGFYGRRRSALHVEGESWNTGDPAFRKEKGHMNGTMLAEFTYRGQVGYGILITMMLERDV
jgi:hypothetical protein